MDIILYYLAIYLLIGTLQGCWVERLIRKDGGNVDGMERFSLVCFWPIMSLTFVYHFIRGFRE